MFNTIFKLYSAEFMKKDFKTRLLLLLLIIGGFELSAQSKREKMGVEEFEKELNTLTNEQVVDVRTPDEFSKGFIDGAFNIDVNGPEFVSQASALDKSKPVLIYCLSGVRSAKAAEYLRKQGFVRVVELEGGMMKWNAAKKPVTAGRSADKGMTSAEFNRQLKTDKLVLVDFHAPWCAPCKKMAPELQALQDEYRDQLILLKVNADENRILTDSLKVQALPALMIFRNGLKTWSHSGLIGKEKVRSEILKNF
jgi:thioredoxin 1